MVVIFNNTGTWVDGVMVATITMRIHAARRRKPQSGSARGRLSMHTDDWWTLLYEWRPTVQVGNVGTPQSGARCTRRLCGLLTYRRRLGNRESKQMSRVDVPLSDSDRGKSNLTVYFFLSRASGGRAWRGPSCRGPGQSGAGHLPRGALACSHPSTSAVMAVPPAPPERRLRAAYAPPTCRLRAAYVPPIICYVPLRADH